jgi:hypothetical protein
MPTSNPYPLSRVLLPPPAAPFNVTRVKPIHPSTAKTNDAYHAALNKKSAWLPSIVVEPKFNHLQNNRRYGEILARMKLPFKPDGGRIKPQAELP